MRYAKPLLFLALLSPAVVLGIRAALGALGANPIEKITHDTGSMALQCLIGSLAVTPLRRLTGWNAVIGFRRMVGLFAFFYAALHLLTYVVLDQFFDWPSIAGDLTKRPYIIAGAVGVGLLLPLAVTSTTGWIRRLGGRNWQRLHRLAYLAAIAGVVHFWWLVKADVTEPAVYGGVLAVLLGLRVWWAARRRMGRV
jgi:sulfoxide reductase heme-binding subunit YedZ